MGCCVHSRRLLTWIPAARPSSAASCQQKQLFLQPLLHLQQLHLLRQPLNSRSSSKAKKQASLQEVMQQVQQQERLQEQQQKKAQGSLTRIKHSQGSWEHR
jgi:hypothetical protein